MPLFLDKIKKTLTERVLTYINIQIRQSNAERFSGRSGDLLGVCLWSDNNAWAP